MVRVHERMSGVLVDVKVMGLAVLGQLGIESHHVLQGWIRIGLAEVTLDRTGNLRRALERRRPVTPLAETTAAVPGDRCFEILTRRRHQISYAPTHAKAENRDPPAVNRFI